MNDETKIGYGVFAAVVGVILIAWFFGSSSSSNPQPTPNPTGRPPGMSDSDYNYVNGRFRQSGMSAKEAATATQAVNDVHQSKKWR